MTAALAFALALSSQAPAGANGDVHVLAAPACLGTFRASGRVLLLADAEAKRTGAKTVTRALGPVALVRGPRMILPDPAAPDALAPSAVLSARDAVERVIAARAPALRSPEELTFAMPGAPDGLLDRLQAAGADRADSPDLARVDVRLTQVTSASASASALLIEVIDEVGDAVGMAGARADGGDDVLAWERDFVGNYELLGPSMGAAGAATLVPIMLNLGGQGRLKAALDDVAAAAGDARLVVMLGSMQGYIDPRADLCADAIATLQPDVVVPTALDFGRTPAEALAWSTRAHTRLAVVNARPVTGASPFTGVFERDVGGVRTAVIPVVDPAIRVALPHRAQGQWAFDDPVSSVADAVQRLVTAPHPPDLIIVATASADLGPKLQLLPHVDVVLAGGEGRSSGIGTQTRLTFDRPRESVREPEALYLARGATIGVRDIGVSFTDGALTAITDTLTPVSGASPRDEAFARPFRVAEEKDLARDAPMLLPKLDELLAQVPEARALAFGAQVAYRGSIVSIGDDEGPIWSDALLHRMAANTLVQALAVDAAFTAATPRRSDLGNSAVSRRFVRDWVAGKGSVRVVAVKGDALLRIADAVARQEATFPPIAWVYAGGVDVKVGVLGGRRIEPQITYRIALDDKTAARADIAALLEGAPTHLRFTHAPDAAAASWTVDEDGAELEAEDVVLAVLIAPDASFAELITDHSKELTSEWRFALEALEVRGTGGRNSDNIALFAATKETRASQPSFWQIGARAQASSLFDSRIFAWESRFKLQYDAILLDIPGVPAVPQDQVDDVVLSTEGRLNSVSLSFGDAGTFRVVPFLQLAADSEVTPTPDPLDPVHKTLPRQALVRESLGIAAYPGGVVQQVRLGVIVQHDASELLARVGPVRHDVGLGLEWHVAWPLWKFLFTSDVDTRAFVPDPDDRPSDLGLRAQLVHKIALPLTPTTSVFAFLDAMAFYGKVPATDELGWNAIAGGGVTFADLWRF